MPILRIQTQDSEEWKFIQILSELIPSESKAYVPYSMTDCPFNTIMTQQLTMSNEALFNTL